MKASEKSILLVNASVGEHPPAWYWVDDPTGDFEQRRKPFAAEVLNGPFQSEDEAARDAARAYGRVGPGADAAFH
jgi:hypothetical protein